MASTTYAPGRRTPKGRSGCSEVEINARSKPVNPSYFSHLLLVLLFAASGCSALIYEIVWYQLLQFVIGATAISLAILLATFMGGLCLGSMVLPRIALLRRHHPLLIYAALEIGIGVCGISAINGIPLISRIYVAGVGHGLSAILLRGIACSICLLVPTMLMGASLPAVARWVKMTPRGVCWIGLWYGANTAGAVFGCLLAGFYLLRVFNMAAATYIAAAINLAVALVSIAMALRSRGRADQAEQSGAQGDFDPLPLEMKSIDQSADWRPYAAIAVSGASALGAEVIWTRLLGLILGPTVYTFSVVLAVFLVGLALGGGVGALLSPFVRPARALSYCQLCLVLGIGWTAFMLAKSLPYWPVDSKLSVSPWMTFQIDLVRAIWAMLPPTLLWGASFPLAIAAVASPKDDPARPVAGVYAANTVGAIVGALVFSLVLIPGFGTQRAERVLIGFSVLSAICLMVPRRWLDWWPARGPVKTGNRMSPGAQPGRSFLGIGAALMLALLMAALVPAVPAEVIAWGRLVTSVRNSNILYAAEGLNSSIAVSQSENVLTFHVSGKVEASTDPRDMRMQRMLADMPALLHPHPRSVLVVGFGAGVTAGSFVVNPDVERIVVCEIEPLVPRASTRFFLKQNYNVLNDRRTEIVFDDARSYILTTDQKFDVITSDPIHPWVKGSASLYTQEYFELAKQHLNPGGVVAQWVPMYETDLRSVKSEIATFFDVFPNGTIWANKSDDGGSYDLVLLGRAQRTPINADDLQKRLEQPDYKGVVASLRDVGLDSAASLLGTYAGRAEDLSPWLADAQINRDGNLRLQYLAGLAVNAGVERRIYDDILKYRHFPNDLFQGSAQSLNAVRSNLE